MSEEMGLAVGFFASFFCVKTPFKLTIRFYPESSVQ
jgi:hypothetical protein